MENQGGPKKKEVARAKLSQVASRVAKQSQTHRTHSQALIWELKLNMKLASEERLLFSRDLVDV